MTKDLQKRRAAKARLLAWRRRHLPRQVAARRRLVLALNLGLLAALVAGMSVIVGAGGFTVLDGLMLAAFTASLPWLTIGLWNSVIGLWLDRRHGAEGAAVAVTPQLGRITGDEPVTSRVAIVMPLRNEDPEHSLGNLRAIEEALAATPWGVMFDYYVLSDTDLQEIALREETLVARWRREAPGVRLTYRRRAVNKGYKAGNVAEWLDEGGSAYDYFLPLDADSLMCADTILRMVRVMQAAPEIGMLQSLVTGLPSANFFTRAFQFGMRHGMRSYTLGSAWWQADCGPNWGHNILIRTAPFHAHCMLPDLPGRGPLSGPILSHDQVEAALMRRAGFEVRVMAEETDSYEENPPSLNDFIRRDLRWCNGNLQYLRLRLKGLKPLSRVQIALAVQMYVAPVAWIAFLACGAVSAAQPDPLGGLPPRVGLSFFALLMTINLAPKLMGLAQVSLDPARAATYGGRVRLWLSGFAEILVSMLAAPAVAFAATLFVLGLPFGRRLGWAAQQRTRAYLGWGEAASVLWPQTLAGLVLTAWLAWVAPVLIWFAVPILASLTLAIPYAVITAWPPLGRWSQTVGLFDIPEDRGPAEVPAAPAARTRLA